MNVLRAIFRLTLALILLAILGSAVVLSSFFPITFRGYHLSMWLVTAVGRSLLWAVNVKWSCTDVARYKQHQGFIFPNHMSYLDILVLIAIAPVRFLAKQEVRSWPVVGQAAMAVGCVFVKRESKESRAIARSSLAHIDRFPPIVLFPEGRKGPGHLLKPFRYGAFEIVIEGEAPFIPCALVYSQPEWAIWYRGEFVLKAAWRLCRHQKEGTVELIMLDTVYPKQADDPTALAEETHAKITAVLQERSAFTAQPPPFYKE
jgi:1-acyl-sn-glycerol-3-phosphate acyltransferase